MENQKFTNFGELPPELRRMIWQFALPDDIPEICIPWPLEEHREFEHRRSKFLRPFLVDTDFPAQMHVCRESREVAISCIRLRYSPIARCQVPFRAFRPELDILYASVCRPPFDNVIPAWGQYFPVRHIALDLHTIKDGTSLWSLVGHPYLDLYSLTCVLPRSNSILDTATRFRPPVRRCRLVQVPQPSNGSEGNIIYVDHGHHRRMTGLGRYLEEVQDTIGAEFAEILAMVTPEQQFKRWNAAERRFDIDMSAKTFEEYRRGCWVPSSDYLVRFERQNVEQEPSIAESEQWTPLRNPETFRINDLQEDGLRL